MAVPPADELFQDEEDEDARYHIKRGRQAPTEFLKRFREQVNKGISKESPGCKTDEEEQYLLQFISRKSKRKDTD